MQQIYRRADMPKLLCNFIKIKLRHGCSPVNLLHIFRTPFPKNTSGWLLLIVVLKIVSHLLMLKVRSSLPDVFCKKGALRNFAKFTGKHLCQSLFFNKVAGPRAPRPATLLKKILWHRYFPVILRNF